MTHVNVPTEFIEPTVHTDIYGDSIGYTESYDFSRANLSDETRKAAVTAVASICYASPKALGSVSLYDRLAAESAGLPSSSYEFVPVLLDRDLRAKLLGYVDKTNRNGPYVVKYGEFIEDAKYLLTNLRALIADVGDKANHFFNTEEECEIIAKHFKVFKWKIPLFVARQAMRHRCSWQELSRRYVSGKKSAFEFYVSPKMKNITSSDINSYAVDTHDLVAQTLAHYNQAIADGVKPEVARTILPQSMYTTVWSAWQPSQLDVFYKLRLDKHAQSEIRELAQSIYYALPEDHRYLFDDCMKNGNTE